MSSTIKYSTIYEPSGRGGPYCSFRLKEVKPKTNDMSTQTQQPEVKTKDKMSSVIQDRFINLTKALVDKCATETGLWNELPARHYDEIKQKFFDAIRDNAVEYVMERYIPKEFKQEWISEKELRDMVDKEIGQMANTDAVSAFWANKGANFILSKLFPTTTPK